MQKILSLLLSTTWGRSFIGWTSIASFVSMVGIGMAYLALLQDYKTCQNEKTKILVQFSAEKDVFWSKKEADLNALHARQDTMFQLIQKKK